MNRLISLYEATEKLKKVLDQTVTSTNRERVITEANTWIDKREKLMKEIKPPFSDEEKELGKKIVLLNKPIESKMQHIFTVLKEDMQQMKQQKKSNESYTNPYEDVNMMDGMFLDSKL